jgi:hypothetical protein
MTEDEEVAWYNSLGFSTTVTQLRSSYSKFSPQPVNTNTNVLWGTESDELRNYYRLYKRTGYSGFLTQAQYWHDFYVNTYSNWSAGGTNVVEPEHVYMMGLVAWYVDHQDAATLAAINRIIDFILQKVTSNPFYETRVSARCLQCLCYYMEKIGIRATEVNPKIDSFLQGIAGATHTNGFITAKYYVGTGLSVQGMPAGDDLRVLFPGNTAMGIVTGQNNYNLKGFYAAASFQDCYMMHALRVASRVRSNPALANEALAIAQAWVPLTCPPFWDPNGTTYNPLIPEDVIPSAPERIMFNWPHPSTPLWTTQFAAYCPDAALRKTISANALVRQYGELGKVHPNEIIGVPPKYFLWQTWEEGYYLTQK